LTLIFILLAVFILNALSNARLNRVYAIPELGFAIPNDDDAIRRGSHLVRDLAGCTDCHGEDLAGDMLYDDPLFGQIVASNLTAGEGGVGASYRDADWVAAIRHGVGPDRKPLIFVMSSYYNTLSDDDLGAMIAYLKNISPVDNELPDTRVGLLSRGFLLIDPTLLPAEVIDHFRTRPPAPEPEVTVDYGAYLAFACKICHGENFAGGLSVGAGLNLTPGGDLRSWTEADFIRALRTGITPEGDELDPEIMPWRRLRRMTDDELKALWLYLKTLPAVRTQNPP
jgi:mono/diheme cytochrome c family protein